MRTRLAILLLLLPVAVGWAETFVVRDHGRLEIFPVGEWKFSSEDVGELKIVIAPKRARDNAIATLAVVAGGPDEYPTETKLMRRLTEIAQRLAESGEFVERKALLKPIYHQQGFGYYFVFSDAKLVGRPVIPGDFKNVCLGLLRLGPTILVRVQILSDGEETEAFQQLLGMVEGMELRGP